MRTTSQTRVRRALWLLMLVSGDSETIITESGRIRERLHLILRAVGVPRSQHVPVTGRARVKRASGGSPSSSLPYAHQLPHADVLSFHFLFCLVRLRCLYSYTRGTMKTTTTVSLIRLAAALLLVVSAATFTCVSATHIDAERMALERRYTTAHSLGDNYVFDPRDGWETVNTTNLAYKYNYPRSDALSESALDDDDDDYLDDTETGDYSNSTLVPRAKKTSHAKTKKKAAKASKASGGSTTSKLLKGGLDKAMEKLKLQGVGKSEPVIITWYDTSQAAQDRGCS